MAQQGDQYKIPFHVVVSGTEMTPTLVTDLRITIGTETKKYSAGEIEYNDENKTWLFPIRKEQTQALSGSIPYQVGVHIGTSIFFSPVNRISINNSIEQGDW